MKSLAKNSKPQRSSTEAEAGTAPVKPVKGLVVGKFYPPHKGHSYLIETALQYADEVDVLVCDHPDYRIPVQTRVAWLKQLHPGADIYPIEDIGKDDDSMAWAEHTVRFLGYAPDIVFSSEDYGDAYATFMGAKHHLVDRERIHVPISARNIRPDVLKQWQFLQPAVRQNYAIRICVLGAESTGTTTLTKALAKKYRAPWVPEYGRIFTESLPDPMNYHWKTEDFVHIARMQKQIEDYAAGISDGLLFCDTNAFATRLWHKRYMGFYSDRVDDIAKHDKVDLYIITDVDIPFVQDGIRDGKHVRHEMHKDFVKEVSKTGTPSIIVTGSVNKRMRSACKVIDEILERKVII